MVLFITMFPLLVFATGGPGVPGGSFFQGTEGGPRSVMILVIDMLLLARFRVWWARGYLGAHFFEEAGWATERYDSLH